MNSVYTKGSKFIVMLDQDIVDEKELGAFTLSARAGGVPGIRTAKALRRRSPSG